MLIFAKKRLSKIPTFQILSEKVFNGLHRPRRPVRAHGAAGLQVPAHEVEGLQAHGAPPISAKSNFLRDLPIPQEAEYS